ncbi:MAG: glycosyltransferase family 4 protein [Oscillospiraceae bacterium]|jgi:glycosyltransferase involved in cell wall biosynthesis|nr:glycosyltransferase family 4 protein [Oscillospiraceae bacterium]
MSNEPLELSQFVKNMLVNERPGTVLEISGFDTQYGQLIADSFIPAPIIDRISLSDDNFSFEDSIYDNVYSADHLLSVDKMSRYDVIIIFHLIENMVDIEAKSLIKSLLEKTKTQILIITPIYPYDLSTDNELSKVRAYHPIFFLGMDFNYKLILTTEGKMQTYSFFPKIAYELLPCDILPCDIYNRSQTESRQLKIAYIVPHQGLTGGLKAMLQQIKELAAKGHLVNMYCRGNKGEALIPSWSHLTDNDITAQIAVPDGAEFLDYIGDEDIIVLGWVDLLPSFYNTKIPVVLWEQGSGLLFGDHRELQYSKSTERLLKHRLYRIPVSLLAVSETIRTILKDIYNRESQFFPNGIDTDFYFPLKQKNNTTPVVLLVGNPHIEFKGFEFMLSVLVVAQKVGLEFDIWCASQSEFTNKSELLKIKKFIEPSQEKLAELYRNADIFMSASLYESFALPPLEAMASGAAVISTDCGGINTYAKPGINCLLCDQGDFDTFFFALQHLIKNPAAREALAIEGRKTALEFSFQNIIPILEKCLIKIIDAHK